MKLVPALLVGAVVVLRRMFLVVRVSGSSMEPALTSGSRVLVRRTARPRRGSVVVVCPSAAQLGRLPRPDPSAARLVKRVAAVAGDAVPAAVTTRERQVPDGRFVALGDNAARSLDSRQLGLFDTTSVLGVAVRVLRAG